MKKAKRQKLQRKVLPKEDALSRAAREQEEREGAGTAASIPLPAAPAAPEAAKGSSDGLKEEPAAEGSQHTVFVSRRGGAMSNAQLAFAAHHALSIKGRRYVPPPPPPPEIDPMTAKFLALREEQKKEQQKAHFAELRERHKNDPRKTSIKRRVRQLTGERVVRKRKEVDPNAPRPENPYKEGSMKARCYAHYLAHASLKPEKLEAALVEMGASASTAKGWLRIFERYKNGGEK